MKLILSNPDQIKSVVSRMMFLAYNATGSPMGMGVFRQRNSVSEAEVYNNAYNKEDYFGRHSSDRDDEIYGDYVFGRMIKWGCRWDENYITFTNPTFRPDYQGFSRTYKDNKSLAIAALMELNIQDYKFED